ncbi:MAG: aconitase X catalytic domain-containing protein [Nitrososphaerales archaeon]|nr:aconitase X catalytic domain-containing protein [Nitrososphaerales archaeon]
MYLTPKEERILAGEEGEVRQKAMEIIVAIGEIYNADRLIPISSAHISGTSYKTIGDAGIEWIESLTSTKFSVPTTVNPFGMDLALWEIMGIRKDFAEKQMRIVNAFLKLGATLTCSCIPYLIGNIPKFGEHIAWAESSAVCYANSVLGARTNREGGPSALASAIIGLTGNFGYHLNEMRNPTVRVKVEVDLNEESDFGALGHYVGKRIGNGVPYFTGIKRASNDELKSLSAALAASGGVALYHIKDITPESSIVKSDGLEEINFTKSELKDSYEELSTVKEGKVDIVCLGCPHSSIEEIKKVAEMIKGKKVAPNTKLWLFTSLPTKILADRCGYSKVIEEAGGNIYCDCCMVIAPIEDLGFKVMAVNSAKAAVYVPTLSKMNVVFGNLKRCIEIAISGEAK